MAYVSKPGDAASAPSGPWFALKKVFSWLLDWFAIQPLAIRQTVLVVAALIPATAIYSFTLLHQQATLAAEVKAMVVTGRSGEGMWTFNDKLPVVFGTGSVLGFLDTHPVERIFLRSHKAGSTRTTPATWRARSLPTRRSAQRGAASWIRKSSG